MKYVVIVCLSLVACSSDDDGGGVDAGGGGSVDARSSGTIDAASQTFPAVCQELPLSCPDAASLMACEARSATAFSSCSYLPITTGCASSGCPSDAQICRTAETSAGYCTHSCVDNDDCPIAGGGLGTCQTFNGTVKICVIN